MVFGGENPESYYDAGVTAVMRGDLPEAVRCFERAAGLDPGFSGAYHQLGKCYLRLGEAKKAVGHLENAVRARPNQVPPRIDLGYALLDAGKVERARAIFGEVIQVKPDNHRAQLGFAFCAFQEGNWESAAALAQNVVNLGNAGFATQYLLGRAAKLAKQALTASDALDAAEATMTQSIETSPDQPEGYYLRGCIHFARENFADAIQDYREAESRATPDEHYSAYGERFNQRDILGRLGLCLQRLGRGEQAKDIGERILKEDPENKTGKLLTQE